MSQILLDIPEDSLLALRVSADEMGEELRMAAAAKLFELGRLSSGSASIPTHGAASSCWQTSGEVPCGPGAYRTPSSSTSKINVAFGGITPPAPRAP